MTTIDQILKAAESSTEYVCEIVLLIPVLWSPELVYPVPAPRNHIIVPLMNDRVSMHVGMLASWETCSYIVRVMLSKEFADPLEDQDVADGVSEMMNMVAGQMKTRLHKRLPSLKIGFPTIQLESSAGSQAQSIQTANKSISIGVYDATVTVMVRESC